MSKPPTPANLRAHGKRFWDQHVTVFDFRVDELQVLEDACREIDLIDRLESEIRKGELIVKGSMGQDVANPLIGEVRQHRALVARLVKQLDLPDDSAEDESGDRSTSARAAAEARWRGKAS